LLRRKLLLDTVIKIVLWVVIIAVLKVPQSSQPRGCATRFCLGEVFWHQSEEVTVCIRHS
jgi:hypothetical protein